MEPKERPHFLWNVHYFRAVAILFIVLTHIFYIPNFENKDLGFSYLDKFRFTVFEGSTIFFITISGFLLFHLRSYVKAKKYYFNKIKNILIPYLVISVVIIVIKATLQNEPVEGTYHFFQLLVTGKTQFHLWYIPFISLLFLISPLLIRILPKIPKWLLISICLLPILGTRTQTEITIWQYLYFFPLYLFGMVCSLEYERIIHFVKNNNKTLSFILVAATYGIFVIPQDFEIFTNSNISESLFAIQKSIIWLLFITYVPNREFKKLKILDILAKYSFAIYFLHITIHAIFLRYFFIDYLNMVCSPLWYFLIISIYSITILAMNMLLVFLIKRIMGSKSVYLIGY